MEMDFFVEKALEDMKTAFEWAELFKKSGSKHALHRLILTGEYAGSAYSKLYKAKERIALEEWEVWKEIYWDFRADLENYVEE